MHAGQYILSLICVLAPATAILGVAPEDEAKYVGATFRCLTGSDRSLPREAVNDEFCDCTDGSDEPGTGACAGQDQTWFYCANKGSTPRRLYASRVGDNICDCCDGSDEAVLAARSPAAQCPNDCAAQGVREREKAQKRLATLRKGLAQQQEARQSAMVERAEWNAQILQLQQELPALEAALATAKVAADAEREALAQLAINASSGCVWRQTGDCKSDGPREPANDKPCNTTVPNGASGFCDCDGDGIKGEGEPGYECKEGPGTCSKACSATEGETTEGDNEAETKAEQEKQPEAAATEEKPQVSEYTKWMEGAESAMASGTEAVDESGGDEKKVSEYAKWMEGAGGKPASSEEPSQEASSDVAVGETEKAGGEVEPSKPSAVDEETAARNLVQSNKDRMKELQAKLDVLPEEYSGYAALAGKTLSKRIGEFEYKLEFFKNAKQDYTSLGSWKKWTGPRHGSFEDGQRCWDGPNRKLEIEFICGEEGAIEDVTEPSRCVYSAIVSHHGACDPAEVQELESGTRIVGPRDEL